MALAYDDALAFLQKVDSKDGASSVYEQLTRVVGKLLDEKPEGPIDLVEVSTLAKITAYDKFTQESSPLVPTSTAADAAKTKITAELYAAEDIPIDTATGEPVPVQAPNEYAKQDLVADAALFDAVGVGLGMSEMYGIMLAQKKLGDDPDRGVKTTRFFGKFFGLYNDYFVFETTMKTAPEIPAAPEGSTPYEVNTGANQYVYWVCTSLGGDFTQLPYVKPAEIKVARQIKKFLTGRLTSPVSIYPDFPGTEANYLRAQIARIAATTVCVPSGSFAPNDETEELELSEDFEGVPGRDASQLGTWVHRLPHLKKQGRCVVHTREAPEGEEDNPEWEPTEEEQEEEVEALGSIEGDTALNGTPAGEDENAALAWTGLVSSTMEDVKFQVGGVRSNLWPGAFCVAKEKQFASVYVGWGQKNAAFVPLPPPPVTTEFELGMVETTELAPKPVPPPAEGEEEVE